MQSVLDCASEHLTTAVSLESLVPGGEVAWDACDCEGQLWVRLINIVPTGQEANCPPTMWNLVLGVGVVRCVSSLDDQARPPTAAKMTSEAKVMTQDAADIYEALVCCSIDNAQRGPTIGQWSPVGALGGCAGGEWQTTIRIGTCACPE